MPLINITEGGEGGRTKGNTGNKGKPSPFKGRHHSEKTKKQMSDMHKGKPSGMQGKHFSEETRKLLSKVHKSNTNTKGFHHGEETRKKMSESKKGEKNPNFGKHRPASEKTKELCRIHALRKNKGKIPWNKGKHNHLSAETVKKMSDVKKGNRNAIKK